MGPNQNAGDSPARVVDWQQLAVPRKALAAPVHLTVFRHGETTRNAQRRISGSDDVELTPRGREQALRLGPALDENFDAAFHSGLRRSTETLQLASRNRERSLGRIQCDPRIAERSMGELEGMPSVPIRAYDDGDLTWAPAGGEPYLSVTQRVLSFLRDLEDAAATAGNLRVLISSHVGPMRVLLSILDGVSDPAAMMTSQYPNATPERRLVTQTTWPAFLDPTLVGLT